MRFRKGFWFVRKEHHAELTHDGFEARIRERQRRGVGRLELDLLADAKFGARDLEHRRIEIGRGQAGTGGQCVSQLSGDNAGAGRRLQHPRRMARGGALRDVGGIIDEDHRAEAFIVVLRDAADKTRCVITHETLRSPWAARIARRRGTATALDHISSSR